MAKVLGNCKMYRPDLTARIVELWNQGLCVSQLSVRLDVSMHTVRSMLDHAGIDRKVRLHKQLPDVPVLGKGQHRTLISPDFDKL